MVGYSCKTALLRVYIDIVTTVGKGDHFSSSGHVFVIVHIELKLMVVCLIYQVCCVGCHRAQL